MMTFPSSNSLKLLGNRVLLQPLNQPDVSPGGILYARQYQDDGTQFTVLAVGPGRRRHGVFIPPEVHAGDRCLCHAARGCQATLDDGSIIVDAAQIEAVWPGPPISHPTGIR